MWIQTLVIGDPTQQLVSGQDHAILKMPRGHKAKAVIRGQAWESLFDLEGLSHKVRR